MGTHTLSRLAGAVLAIVLLGAGLAPSTSPPVYASARGAVAADGTASAAFNEFDYDRVGTGASLQPDGSPDGTFTIRLDRGGSHRVTSLRLVAGSGGGIWSTTADAYWVLGVTATLDGAPLVNRDDKSIDVPMTDALILRLYAADQGYITGVATFTITACFDDSTTDCATATVNATAPLPVYTGGGQLPPPPGGAAGPDFLGTQWDECETHTNTFCGPFVRQGTSTTWTLSHNNGASGTLTILPEVRILRQDPDGLQAEYTGTIAEGLVDGSVTWWYDPRIRSTGTWYASITGGTPFDPLGTQWDECETHTNTFCGPFVRQGTSNTWTLSHDNGATGTLTVLPAVRIFRQDPDGLQAEYEGTITGNQVEGSVEWWYDPRIRSTGIWNATINGNVAAVPPPQPQPVPSGDGPTDGLVSWWKADGDYLDSRDGNHGTAQGSVPFVAGQVGQAFGFNLDPSSYISLGNPANLKLVDALSIFAWINVASVRSDGQLEAIVSKWAQRFDPPSPGSHQDSYLLDLVNSGGEPMLDAHLLVDAGGGGAYTPQEPGLSAGPLPLNQWVLVGMTYDRSRAGNNFALWIDCASVDSPVGNHPIVTSDTNVLIAHEDSYLGRPFDGSIDNVRIYNRALAAGEVSSMRVADGSGAC